MKCVTTHSIECDDTYSLYFFDLTHAFYWDCLSTHHSVTSKPEPLEQSDMESKVLSLLDRILLTNHAIWGTLVMGDSNQI